jgi:transposase-like protein
MERNSLEIKTLQQAIRYFSDEQVCIDTVASLRWADSKPTCPACGRQEHYYLKTQKRWKCKECYKQFSVKLGTIFEDSPITLDKWLIALWMLTNCRNGVSSYEVARALGITQKSAWFVLHRLRLAMREGFLKKMGGSGSPIEADETFVGGKTKNMHKRRRDALQRAMNANVRGDSRLIGKTVVMGMFDREARKVRATVVPNTKRQTLQAEILRQVEEGSEMHTDESTSYMGLTSKYAHQIVNHLERYVDGKVTTNGIENFWSLLKRGLSGTYVAVEPFHLERYVDEQVFRYNTRKNAEGKKLNDGERFQRALSQIANKRLTYAELTGKTPEASNATPA